MKPLLAALALLLAACAGPKPAPLALRAEPVPKPVEILIETSPPGGIVDWNGNVLGAAPVTLTITPRLTYSGRPKWPETGASAHIFRARWPNGARAAAISCRRKPAPTHCHYLPRSPQSPARNYRRAK